MCQIYDSHSLTALLTACHMRAGAAGSCHERVLGSDAWTNGLGQTRLWPDVRKLELFGRNHNRHEGWVTLGNQLEKTVVREKWLNERLAAMGKNEGLLLPVDVNDIVEVGDSADELAQIGALPETTALPQITAGAVDDADNSSTPGAADATKSLISTLP